MPLLTSRRRGFTALVAALAAVVPTSAHAAVPAPSGATSTFTAAGTPSAQGGTDTSRTVTLITGDRVTVTYTGGHTTATVSGPTGGTVGAHIMTQGKDLLVYPDSALPYLASGALDPRLFDVTELIADGYDDARSDHLPLIVSYTDTAFRSRATAVPKGGRRTRELNSVQGAAVSEEHAAAPVFWASLTGAPDAGSPAAPTKSRGAAPGLTGGIGKVWLDGKAKAALADSTAQIGAPQVWQGGGTGQGVDIAVLDSGIDAGHPDFGGRIAATVGFVPGEDATDRFGHGTHVASTVGGTGAASGGKEKGVAPGAALHIAKVLADDGTGQESWILAGMEWAARDQHAKVVNMSLGGRPSDGSDPLSQAVNRLSAETGALFVTVAGNDGSDPYTVNSPGAADAALTVGAVDGSDRLTSWSGRGPRLGDSALKPDLTAPGVDILAARSQYISEGEGYYMTDSGTSMAAPHVAGAAALLAQVHPDWTGQQLKDALLSTTAPTPRYSAYAAGSGRADVAAAVHGTVFATGSVFAPAHWPYPTSGTVRKDVTYTNTGTGPVTLRLAVDAPGSPAGLFTVTDPQVTVPARGTATVGVLTHLDVAADDTGYSARLNASDASGTLRAHTVVGSRKESRKVQLSLMTKGPDGAGLAGTLVLKDIARDTFPKVLAVDASGRLELPVQPSTYAAWLYADVPGMDGPHSLGRAIVADQEIVVGGDRSVVLDGSDLRKVEAITPKTSVNSYVRVDQSRSYGDLVPFHDTYQLEPWTYDSLWATPTPKVTQGAYTFTARWRQVQSPLTVSAGSHTFGSVLMQSMSPALPAGRGSFRAVEAGDGSAAAFAGVKVRGRVAVVRRNDAVAPADQAAAAAAADARLLLIVNDGYGPLDAWSDLPDGAPLPVASLGTDEGRALLARFRHKGTTTLKLASHPHPDYLYDLVIHQDGSIPRNLSHRPGPGDLARIEETVQDTRQGEANDLRYDLSPDETWVVGSPATTVRAQGTYTAWITAGSDAVWLDLLAVPDLTEVGGARSYKRRSTSRASWFAPVQHPRLLQDSLLANAPNRVGDFIGLYGLPAYGDAGGHAGTAFDSGSTVHASLYQGSTLLADGDDLINSDVSPATLPYRLVEDTTRDVPGRPYSTRTHTEWDFTSGHLSPTTKESLPLVQLDYAVPTDLSGKARRRAGITVIPSQSVGTSAGRFRTVALDLSYDDGVTWTHTPPSHKVSTGWHFTLNAPAEARFVTLRATAQDTAGNNVVQTVVRAFGLK
ncbi:S8 family serine peptidase [Streptomyces sp. NPDC057428]|uniref:S8 family serine peptidase n=1 Tax=Streptomyces sp. NPDC057428 TaxID=3346129 RepID=UPI0036BE80A5